ncbi:MAG TPA: hypothetical protein PKG60_02115 [Spirochaetota bacterium]|nr:hypothetical protein [Spirochaetota bacterium]HPS85888.1 hypothetical protein [Spirochaetota bacterium]
MANDNEVKKDLVPFGSKFLPAEIANIDGGSEVYSLENEFSKTRKNKNWLVFIIVFVFILITVAFTLIFTYYTGEKDKNIDVSITEFNDLRLKEILNSSRLAENNIQIRNNELQSLLVEMKNKILEVNNRYLVKENSILDKGISAEAARSRTAELNKAEQSEINGIKAQYESKINEKVAQINRIQEEKRAEEIKLEKAKKNIGNIGDENKIYAMKMKSLSDSSQSGLASMADYYNRYVKYLILKYNPVFSSGELRVSLDKNSNRNEIKNLRGYDDLFQKENVLSRKRFDDLRVKIYEHDLLVQRLIGVGYENSVPPALKSIDNLSSSIVNDYENLWFGLVSTVKQKNSQIEDYKTALDAVLKEKPESGYIISAENPARISIHINRLLTVKEGGTGLVFRTDDKYIGKIEFYRTADGLKAKVVSLAGSNKMRPFDRILIKIK